MKPYDAGPPVYANRTHQKQSLEAPGIPDADPTAIEVSLATELSFVEEQSRFARERKGLPAADQELFPRFTGEGTKTPVLSMGKGTQTPVLSVGLGRTLEANRLRALRKDQAARREAGLDKPIPMGEAAYRDYLNECKRSCEDGTAFGLLMRASIDQPYLVAREMSDRAYGKSKEKIELSNGGPLSITSLRDHLKLAGWGPEDIEDFEATGHVREGLLIPVVPIL